jgi:hypothetical protein
MALIEIKLDLINIKIKLNINKNKEYKFFFFIMLEKKVAIRNLRNIEQMVQNNKIFIRNIFPKKTFVSLWIPPKIYMIGELKYIYYRVVQYIREGY